MKSAVCLMFGVMFGANVMYIMFEQRIFQPSVRRTIQRTLTKYRTKTKAQLRAIRRAKGM